MLNKFNQSSFLIIPKIFLVEIFVSLFEIKEKIFSFVKISLFMFFPCLKLFEHSIIVLYNEIIIGSFSINFS
jgi:hypothetical protein